MSTPAPLPVRLERAPGRPLAAQLSTQIRALILSETLRRNDRLPSSRALAVDLRVSRSTTETAYEQLVAEGWLEARHGSGTVVAAGGLAVALPTPAPTPPPGRPMVRLDAGTPWIDPRHAAGWRRAWREVSSATTPRGYDDPRGLPDLRIALAARLARTRGLRVDPDEVIVTGGTTDGLRHLLSVLPAGDVALEDPGYRAAVETARGAGRLIRDLPALERIDDLTGVAAAYVTPAHQHPLGRVMPAADRLALLAAARSAGAVVIEDDYDSEFRYDVAPVPALASLDRSRVAYLGTAAKSVAPSLRLGWLVAPPPLHEAINARRAITHDSAPWPTQRALVTLLRDGYVDQVVRSARQVYAERAPRVARALAPYADAAGPSAGMYSTWLLPQERAVAARARALREGYEVNLLSDYCRTTTLTGLVLGFGGVDDDELDAALAALVESLDT